MTATSSAASPAIDRVFAYGTMMTGFSRRRLLGPAILEGPARIRGALYDFGEYPGLVLDASGVAHREGSGRVGAGVGTDGAGWVVGELYRVPDLAARLATLDAEEWHDPANPDGSLYVRQPVVVATDGGAREAWVYLYNPAVGGPAERAPRIESGDWRAHVTIRPAAPR